jgi:transcriptional regulator with XRE-family HTH domain
MQKNSRKKPSNNYGNFIRLVRGQMLLTLEDLGKELDVSHMTIMRWEHGKSEPSFLNKRKIESYCELNGIDITKFM